jgi:hypothetical protein
VAWQAGARSQTAPTDASREVCSLGLCVVVSSAKSTVGSMHEPWTEIQ